MKVRFTRDIEVEMMTDICCFSGGYAGGTHQFKAGDEVAIGCIWRGKKVKARHKDGGPYYPCSLLIDNANIHTLHPDRYLEVPSNAFEVLE